MAAVIASSMTAGGMVSASAVAVGVAAATVAVAASPAKAAVTGTVLVLLQNGEVTAPETTLLENAGYTVQQATPSQWQGMSTTAFGGYAALVIGDPSSGSCSALTPTLSGSGGDVIGTNWQAAVTGNISVLGTAPALAETSAANSLITGAVGYAAAAYSSQNGTGTGLYVSLNCDYASSPSGTAVAFLNGVENIGTTAGQAGAVTVQGGLACADAGTVNGWEAESSVTLSTLTSGMLSGSGNWPAPSCPVQEAFDSWPANFTPVGYDAASDAAANFTASDGQSGQPYMILGAPPLTTSTQTGKTTLALAPSTGGQMPAMSTAGGGNPVAPGADQDTADGVNTENGDFAQSTTDTLIPTFGPSLEFTRTYDAQAAQAQTKTLTPGPMGYGWTDNWATSVSTSNGTPVADDIYAISGLGTDNGIGGPPTGAPLSAPYRAWFHGGNVYLDDTGNNRILEIPGSTGTQWGIPMTAGDLYQVVGSPLGQPGSSKSGTSVTKALLNEPTGITLDSAGNLYIADSGNDQVIEIPATSGTYWGQSMNANDVYRIAGHRGSPGHSGDGGLATSAFLNTPIGLAFDTSGDLYIADSGNNRVQEVFTSGGQQWAQAPMTANDVYTVAGSSTGTSGDTSQNGTLATSALLNSPYSVAMSSGGDLFIADTFNNRVVEVPKSGGTEWGISMSANDLYTVAGSATGASGSSGDGGLATSAKLNEPYQVSLDNGKQLYIADTGNNKIREVAWTTHSEWNVSMTANDIYTIAGTGTAGYSGDGGAALAAKLNGPEGFALDGTGELYINDTNNNRTRVVSGSTYNISRYAGNGGSLLSVGDNGPALGAAYQGPAAVATDASGNIYVADEYNNRVQEIAVSSHTQFGITMTAGDVYTVAGNANGNPGTSSSHLNSPLAVAVDANGNLYIADSGNNRIQEVAASSGTITTITGSSAGASGVSGDGGSATAALLDNPNGVAVDASGNVYIADFFNERVQEVPAANGIQWGQSMTGGDMYTVAGDKNGVSSGTSGDGGPVKNALLNLPAAVTVDPAGDVYIADSGNNRVQEMYNGGQAWGQPMTVGDMYTVAGNASGGFCGSGSCGDGGPATAALLNNPVGVTVGPAGDLYIADTYGNRIQEVAAGPGVQWAQQMTPGDIYTIAGSASGALGDSGLGGSATLAQMNGPESLAVDPYGNLYIPDSSNNLIDEVVSAATTGNLLPLSPAPGSDSPAGVIITQPNAAQVTFYPVGSGCFMPYVQVASGQYCALPQDVGVNLSYSGGTYTFTPAPGVSLTYNSAGQLTGESDAAEDTLTVQYGTPLPGSGNCPSSASWCELITAANGRTLTIGYNGSSLITSVTDPMGRRWTYGYTGSDLTSVTDPLGNVTSFTYGEGSTSNPLNASNLLTVTDPNGQPGGPDAGADTVNAYNSAGQVISETDPSGAVTSFNYCVNAKRGNCMSASTGTGYTTVTDPEGNTLVDGYSAGELISQASLTGGTTLTSETDSGPIEVAGVANAGSLLDAWDTSGGSLTQFTYDPNGNEVSAVDPMGYTTTAWSTALGQLSCNATATATSLCSSSQTGPAAVAPAGAITAPATPPMGVTYAQFDTNGSALSESMGVYQPGSQNPSSVLTDYTLYKGNTVTLNGNQISCAATPPSPVLPCATIDANGVVTQIGYNSYGDLTSISGPDGNGSEMATATFGYDGDGEQTSVTSPDGNVAGANAANFTTVTAFDGDGDVTSVTSAGGTGATTTPRTTSYGYDPNGNQMTVTDARGYATTTTYNAVDEAVQVTDPLGNTDLTCYDPNGNVSQTVPPAGVAASDLTLASCPTSYPSGYGQRLAADATTTAYDASGNVTQVTTPAPAGQTGYETTTYAYDLKGNLTKTTAPPASSGGGNQVTVDSYDANGDLTSQTSGYGTSAASTTTYCYDPNGNETAVVPPDGNAAATAPCNTNPSYPWIVDPTAYPTQAAYQTIYSYDSQGDTVSVTRPATSAAPNGQTTSLSYDSSGQLHSSTDPNGVTTTFGYNAASLLSSVSYSGSSAPSVGYTYDAAGRLTAMTDGTGTSSFGYDPFGELTSATNGAGQTVGYGYDADGNATSITYPLPSSASWATSDNVGYGYDKDDDITSITDFNGNQVTLGYTADGLPSSASLGSTGDTITTSYDPAGNVSAINLKNATSTLLGFSYSDAPSGGTMSETDTPSSSQSPATYAYDAQGRITSMTPGTGSALNYGFDASGNLTTLPTGAGATYDHGGELTSSTLAGTTTSYAYDADGKRLTAKQGSATVASGTWNGAGELTAYSDAAAAMSGASYDGDGLRASATFTPAGGSASTQNFVWDTVGSLLMDSANAYVYDGGTGPAEQVNLATGTVSYLVADSLGSIRGVVSSAGALTASTSYDAWGNPQASGGLTASTPFGYAGGYTDPTGLIYLISRYYDPQTGQFASVDPDVDQTGQPYAYTGGDPVVQSDPSGLAWAAHVSCRCYFSLEIEFQDKLAEYLGVAAGAFGARLIQQPMTGIKLCKVAPTAKCDSGHIGDPAVKNFIRYPDIYWYHPDIHYGWENELKVGSQTLAGRNVDQSDDDDALLSQGYGWGTNKPAGLKGKKLPVNMYIWWFAPVGRGGPFIGAGLTEKLLKSGINFIIISYEKGSKHWPRTSSAAQKESVVRALQSGNEEKAQAALQDSMFAPCNNVCHV